MQPKLYTVSQMFPIWMEGKLMWLKSSATWLEKTAGNKMSLGQTSRATPPLVILLWIHGKLVHKTGLFFKHMKQNIYPAFFIKYFLS
jgi:hypothetical protein